MPVEFDEPQVTTRSVARPERISSLSKLVIKTGIVKTEQGAQLLFFVLAALLIALSVFFFVGSSSSPPQPTPAQVIL